MAWGDLRPRLTDAQRQVLSGSYGDPEWFNNPFGEPGPVTVEVMAADLVGVERSVVIGVDGRVSGSLD